MVYLRENWAERNVGWPANEICHKRLWRFQKQSCWERGWKARFSTRCKAQEAWSSGVSEWPAVQALIRYLQNLWLFLSAVNLTGTTTRLSFDETVTRVQHYYAFHDEASLKVQGIKGSTSQTQGPDGTLSATTLNSVKMILEGQRWSNSIQTSFNT